MSASRYESIAGIADLISMKTEAGRPQDLRDIEALRQLLKLEAE